MEKRDNVRLLAGALILGVLFNYLFYEKDLGISYPIFLIAFYLVLFWCAQKIIIFKFNAAWVLTIPVLMLSLTYCIYSNEILRMLNFLVIPLLIVAQTILMTGNNTYAWHSPGYIADMAYGLFYRTFSGIIKPFGTIASFFPRKSETAGSSVLRKVILGLLISLPLVLIVISLLVSADQIFKSYIDRIPNIFKGLKVEEYVVQAFIIIFIFLTTFSYIKSLTDKKKLQVLPAGLDGMKLPKVWDPVIVITVISIVNLIYILFAAVQFAYLFGGIKFELPDSFTYSEYARRGFFELIVVTLINLSILLASIGFTRAAGGAAGMAVRVLHTLLVGSTLVMLSSAWYRMLLYEEAYGFTYLRVFTQAFMAFLLVIFVITIVRIWNDGIYLVKPYVIAALAAFVIVNYINVDAIIARNNIDRFYRTNIVDTAYLSNLSYDAMPWIAKLTESSNPTVALEALVVLGNKKVELEKQQAWQTFSISKYKADILLGTAKLFDSRSEDTK